MALDVSAENFGKEMEIIERMEAEEEENSATTVTELHSFKSVQQVSSRKMNLL